MRRHVLALVLVAWSAHEAHAAETPRVELFGGYAFARSEGENQHGWNAALAWNLTQRFALIADVSGQYGSARGLDSSQTTLTAGPGVALVRGNLTATVHALAGLVRSKGSLRIFNVTISETENRFGALLGGGVDLKVGERWAVRLAQADYVYSRKGGQTENGLRLSTGLVYRFR